MASSPNCTMLCKRNNPNCERKGSACKEERSSFERGWCVLPEGGNIPAAQILMAHENNLFALFPDANSSECY